MSANKRQTPKGKSIYNTGGAALVKQVIAAERAAQRMNMRDDTRAMVPSYVGNLPVGGGSGLVEKKVVDINAATYLIENTGTILTLLNGTVPGSQNFNRIGRKIALSSLQIRGFVRQADNTVAARQVRMIIVYDKQANASAPTFANVISSQNIGGTVSSTCTDMVNLDNRDRFRIIRDRTFVFGDINAAWAAGSNVEDVDMYIKLGDLPTIYNAGSAGTIGDIQSGSLYVFWISTQANSTGSAAEVSYRLRFKDL